MQYFKLILVFVVSLSIMSACEQQGANIATNTVPPPAATPQITPSSNFTDKFNGQEIYATNCMICHKESGTGGKFSKGGKSYNAANLTTDKMKAMTDVKLVAYVTDGIEDEGNVTKLLARGARNVSRIDPETPERK